MPEPVGVLPITAHLRGGPLDGDVIPWLFFGRELRYPEDDRDGGRYALAERLGPSVWAYQWTPKEAGDA